MASTAEWEYNTSQGLLRTKLGDAMLVPLSYSTNAPNSSCLNQSFYVSAIVISDEFLLLLIIFYITVGLRVFLFHASQPLESLFFLIFKLSQIRLVGDLKCKLLLCPFDTLF